MNEFGKIPAILVHEVVHELIVLAVDFTWVHVRRLYVGRETL